MTDQVVSSFVRLTVFSLEFYPSGFDLKTARPGFVHVLLASLHNLSDSRIDLELEGHQADSGRRGG